METSNGYYDFIKKENRKINGFTFYTSNLIAMIISHGQDNAGVKLPPPFVLFGLLFAGQGINKIYPFSIGALTFAYYFIAKILNRNNKINIPFIGLLALLWGGLLGINTWDVIIYSILFSILILLNLDFKNILKTGGKDVSFLILAGITSALLYFPLFGVLSQGKPLKFGFNLKSLCGIL